MLGVVGMGDVAVQSGSHSPHAILAPSALARSSASCMRVRSRLTMARVGALDAKRAKGCTLSEVPMIRERSACLTCGSRGSGVRVRRGTVR